MVYRKERRLHPWIEAVRDARIEEAVSMGEVARRLGVQQTQLARYERGDYRPQWEMMERWAALFGYHLGISKETTSWYATASGTIV